MGLHRRGMSEGPFISFVIRLNLPVTPTLKGTINARINILYLLDSLCEASLLSKSNSNIAGSLYVDYVSKDLGRIVDYVVPEGREGLINLMSAVQVSKLCLWMRIRSADARQATQVLK